MKPFNPKTFVSDEKAIIDELLARLGSQADEVKHHANQVLEIAAKIAAARLENKDTLVAQVSLKASVCNLQAYGSMTLAHAVISYIEGALIRVAKAAGAILLA